MPTSPDPLEAILAHLEALHREVEELRGALARPLLTVPEAIRLLGIRASDGRAWLEAKGLISTALGTGSRARVLREDLLEALREGRPGGRAVEGEASPRTSRRGQGSLPRVRLP